MVCVYIIIVHRDTMSRYPFHLDPLAASVRVVSVVRDRQTAPALQKIAAIRRDPDGYVRPTDPLVAAACRVLFMHSVGARDKRWISVSFLFRRSRSYDDDTHVKISNGETSLMVCKEAADYLQKALYGNHANHDAPPQRQDGGRDLGKGRDGTKVYTADMIASVYPDASDMCVYLFGSTERSCGAHFDGEEGVAVKDIRDEDDAIVESLINQRVYEWFRKARRHHASPLHPSLNCADVMWAGNKHRLLFYDVYAGDVGMMRLPGGEAQILALARDVCESLVVLHNNGTLHMDIKPGNVLYAKAESGDYKFVLADFGLIAPVDAVWAHALRGGSPSGTDGYISPMIDHTESSSSVSRWFDAVSQTTAWRDQAFTMGWRFKPDLHSLAITLLHIARWTIATPFAEHADVLSAMPVLTRFVSRLMLFRKGDFKTAKAALQGAEAAAATAMSKSGMLRETAKRAKR